MSGAPRQGWDYINLALLHAAKLKRRKFAGVSEDHEEFYESFFTETDEQVLGSEQDTGRGTRGSILAETVAKLLPGPAKVLDVGCGIGDNLRYIYRPDLELHGIEYSRTTAEMAKRVLKGKASIQVASALEIPFPDAEFDLAMSFEVLEHIEDDESAMKDIARVVKPGGFFLVTLPYNAWFKSYLPLMGHYRHYSRTDVAGLLDRHGFDVLEYLPNYPQWSRYASYSYLLSRAYFLLLKPFGSKASPVQVAAPFSNRPLVDVLLEKLEPMRRREAGLDYSHLSTSTFLLGRRRT